MTLKFDIVLEVVDVHVLAKFHQAKWALYVLSTVH